MTDEARWQRYFYDPHGPETLHRWARALRVFRFCRAVGGHSGIDDDTFLAALRYDGEADLLAVFDALGLAPERIAAGAPQPVPDRTYTSAAYNAFPSVVPTHPTIRQPGHVRLAGAAAFVWAGAERVEISVNDAAERWDVSEAAFEAARQIEAVLATLAGRVADPPRDSRHCLCPAFYPEVWAPDASRGAPPA